MALDTAFYLVTAQIAQRAGLVGKRYIASDGRYIFDNKDLSRVRFTTDEYINGLAGVEKIDEATAKTLIASGGFNISIERAETAATEAPAEVTEQEQAETEETTTVEQPEEEATQQEEETETETQEE